MVKADYHKRNKSQKLRKEATPIILRMQAQTAARFEDVLAHVFV